MWKVIGAIVALSLWVSTNPVVAVEQESAATQKPATGDVVVVEEVWFVLVDEPAHHFHRARESFLAKDAKGAAREMRKGAAFMRLEASRAAGGAKEGLMKSVHELETLAGEVEKGAVHSVVDLNHAFARAHHALAMHHKIQASEGWAKRNAEKVAHELEAVAQNLEHAAAWAGHKLESGTFEVINGARTVSGKLLEGAGWTVDEVGKAIDALGQEVGKIGKAIEPTT